MSGPLTSKDAVLCVLWLAQRGFVMEGYDHGRGLTLPEITDWLSDVTSGGWKIAPKRRITRQLVARGWIEQTRTLPRRGYAEPCWRLVDAAIREARASERRLSALGLWGMHAVRGLRRIPRPADIDPAQNCPDRLPTVEQIHDLLDAYRKVRPDRPDPPPAQVCEAARQRLGDEAATLWARFVLHGSLPFHDGDVACSKLLANLKESLDA